MQKKKLILIFLILLYSTQLAEAGTIECGDQTWTTDGTGDQEEINAAIKEGDTVILSGEFCINDPIILDSDTVLDGQGETTITLPDNVNRLSSSEYHHAATKGYAKTMVPLIRATNCENIEIRGIHFDGNADGLTDLITGRGFFNFIMPIGCDGVSVHDCSGENSLGDFLRATKCTNVLFYDIEAERLGHEALFAIRSFNVEMYGCKINCRINSACRIRGSDNAYVHDNYITCTAKESAGPGIQVDVIEDLETNVEICNNIIVVTGGPGAWIVGDKNNYDPSKTSIKIHHNAILGAGWDGRDWQGGVLTSVVHNVEIYNNVFDGCSNAGIVTYRVKGLPTGPVGADFTITAKDNIITNTKKGRNSGSGVGYGLSNTLSSSHNIISEGNVLWDNTGGNYNKCSGDDIVQDPKVDPGSSGWYWTGSSWECDYVSAYRTIWDSSAEVDEKIDEEDYEPVPEREFDSIYSFLGLEGVEFVDSGRTEQTEDDIKYEVEETARGRITGGIKLFFKDVVYRDGIAYIPGEDAIIVKYVAIMTPIEGWWNGGISKFDKVVTKEIKDGIAYANLTISMKWYTIKENKLTGVTRKKYHESTTTFTDSCPAYEIWPDLKNTTGYADEYRGQVKNYTLVSGPSDSVKLVYKYKGTVTTHYYMIGQQYSDPDTGIKYTVFTDCNYWEGDLPHYGDKLYINGSFDPRKLHVEAHTPYENKRLTITHTIHKQGEKAFADGLFEKLIKSLIYLFGINRLIRIVKN